MWMPRRRHSFLLAATVTLAASCGGGRPFQITEPGDIAWPPLDPRVRLREVIELDAPASTGRGKVRRWLGFEAGRGPFRRPYGIAWDGDALLLADPDGGRVARVVPRGRVTFSSEALFVQPIGVASCGAGTVVSDSERGNLALLDSDLRLVRWLAQNLARPTGVSCADGRIFVTETGAHRVTVIEADG
jgi:hypothetical protein